MLAALLGTGSLSDAVGRRPVIVAALSGLAGAMIVFTFAGGLDWLYAARTLQGLATGLLLGATGAALIDLHPRRDGAHAGLVNGIASAAGIGAGAGLPGLLVEYLPDPEVLPFLVIAVLGLLLASAAWRLPEPVERTGSITLRPRGAQRPADALADVRAVRAGRAGRVVGRRPLPLARPQHRRRAAPDHQPRHRRPVRVRRVRDGHRRPVGAAHDVGPHHAGRRRRGAHRRSAATAASIHEGSLAAFLAGSVVVCFGFGAAFTGALRLLSAALAQARRAGVMSAFFVVAYASISIPAISAGLQQQATSASPRRPRGSAPPSRSSPPWSR